MKLRIRDITFKTAGNYQYADVVVNGKTGSRPIPLISSIPYVKDWLDQLDSPSMSCPTYQEISMSKESQSNLWKNEVPTRMIVGDGFVEK